MKQSLGLLEVSGLALAISCADVMAKAASITLVGQEKHKKTPQICKTPKKNKKTVIKKK